ncbi:MAG: hypothetical protein U5K72_18425 [Balneolaceae bacterium]|nr:hypothetical protein [Balneolaceae bacterium]
MRMKAAITLTMRRRFDGTLEKFPNVLAVFHGHRHEGQYSRINGIHYYTFIAMVEGSGASPTVPIPLQSVYDNGDIIITGYQGAESQQACDSPGLKCPEYM